MRKSKLWLMMLLLLVGCGKKNIDYSADDENTVASNSEAITDEINEEASTENTASDILENDERFEEVIETKGAKINVNADVLYDETEPVNTYKASMLTYDGKGLKDIADKLGGTLYYFKEGMRPKELLEKYIQIQESIYESEENYLNILKGDPNASEENIQYEYEVLEKQRKKVNELKQEYENAPEEWVAATEYEDKSYALMYNEEMYNLHTYENDRGFGMNIIGNHDIYSDDSAPGEEYRYKDISVHHQYMEYPESEIELKELASAEAFLDKLQLGEFKMVQYDHVECYWVNDETKEEAVYMNFYVFRFYRRLDGRIIDGKEYAPQTDADKNAELIMSYEDDMEMHKNIYNDCYECVEVSVFDSQIQGMNYVGSLSIGEKTGQNVKTIGLQEAKKIIHDELIKNPPEDNTSYNFYYHDENGDRIYDLPEDTIVQNYGMLAFEYARVRDEKNLGEYMIIPVWCLWGYKNDKVGPTCIIVNAIDGSVIDTGDEFVIFK